MKISMNLTTDETGPPVCIILLANATHHLEGTTVESATTVTMETTANPGARRVKISPRCRNKSNSVT